MIRLKVELNIPPELVSAIADDVVAKLKPILIGMQSKPTQADGLMGVVELGNCLGGVGSISRSEADRQQVLPQVGYLRLKDVLALIPVSKSTWWAGVREGRFPKPTYKFGTRIRAWDVRDIRPLLERGVV